MGVSGRSNFRLDRFIRGNRNIHTGRWLSHWTGLDVLKNKADVQSP
jgi:hypothetical protein